MAVGYELTVFFLAVSLLLYVILGGADYGAGILELRPDPRQSHIIDRAMGPVWEANHIWLIIVVVILFTGFPELYRVLSVHLHLPLVAVLVGIVLRGTAFTFRHYDAIKDGTQKIYTRVFAWSSLWTPFWLGVVACAIWRGPFNSGALSFYELFIAPWWGVFPATVGIFFVCVCAFLAATFLVGESRGQEMEKFFRKRATIFLCAMILSGILVFATAELEGHGLAALFFSHPWALTAFVLASMGLVPYMAWLRSASVLRLRLSAGALVGLVVFGWLSLHENHLIVLNGQVLGFLELASPPATIYQLNLALIVGLILIFPCLIYLLMVFKSRPMHGKK